MTLAALLFLLAGPPEAALQVLVLDPSGARVPGATVSIVGKDPHEAVSDDGGAARFDGLPPGRATVRVSLSGFETQERTVGLKQGANKVEIALALAKLTENVAVRPDERVSASQGFGNVLTAADIAALPDDPEEMEDALRRMAGPGAVLRVNGFSGGRLPPKSQIRQIKFQMNPYSAEFHEAGRISIDIFTKPGLGSWRTGLKSSLRSEALNARPPLAPEDAPDSYQRYGLTLEGPLRTGHTSLALNLDGRLNDGARTIHAALPTGPYSALAPTTTDKMDVQARLEHALGASHTLRAEYQRLGQDQTGLTSSGLDMADRAYGQQDVQHFLRFSDSGGLGKHAATETLLEFRLATTAYDPHSNAPATLVLGSFNEGGAQLDGERRVSGLTLTQNFDWGTRRHALRAGLKLEAEHFSSSESRNAGGSYTFSSLDSFDARQPATFTQRVGDPHVAFNDARLGLYVQDELKLSRKTSLFFGLRNEVQSLVDGGLHLAPRIGVTRALNGKTTLRVGAGLFRDWYQGSTHAEALRFDGRRFADYSIENPVYGDPFSTGATAIAPTRIEEGTALGLPRLFRVSAGVERNMGQALRFMADYSYERGSAQYRSVNSNAPLPGIGRPDPRAGNVYEVESAGTSRRHVANVNGGYMKPGARASLFLGYVFTDSRNDGDGALSIPATSLGLRGEWGPALDDVRHRFFGFGRARLAKGVSLGALMRVESGSPYAITTGYDANGDQVLNDRPLGIGRNGGRGEARVNLDAKLSWSRGFGPQRRPTGPMARIVRIGDGEGPPDLPGPDAERRVQVSIYAQAFNALNHTNVRTYSGVQTSPFFGQASTADPGRRIELGASFSF